MRGGVRGGVRVEMGKWRDMGRRGEGGSIEVEEEGDGTCIRYNYIQSKQASLSFNTEVTPGDA